MEAMEVPSRHSNLLQILGAIGPTWPAEHAPICDSVRLCHQCVKNRFIALLLVALAGKTCVKNVLP